MSGVGTFIAELEFVVHKELYKIISMGSTYHTVSMTPENTEVQPCHSKHREYDLQGTLFEVFSQKKIPPSLPTLEIWDSSLQMKYQVEQAYPLWLLSTLLYMYTTRPKQAMVQLH